MVLEVGKNGGTPTVSHLREAFDAKIQDIEVQGTRRDEKVMELESRIQRQERISAE